VPSLEPQSEDLRLSRPSRFSSAPTRPGTATRKTQFTFIKREKVNILTFHIGNKLLLVSTEPDFTLQQAQEAEET